MSQLVKHVILDLGVVSSSPMLGVGSIKKKKNIYIYIYICIKVQEPLIRDLRSLNPPLWNVGEIDVFLVPAFKLSVP